MKRPLHLLGMALVVAGVSLAAGPAAAQQPVVKLLRALSATANSSPGLASSRFTAQALAQEFSVTIGANVGTTREALRTGAVVPEHVATAVRTLGQPRTIAVLATVGAASGWLLDCDTDEASTNVELAKTIKQAAEAAAAAAPR